MSAADQDDNGGGWLGFVAALPNPNDIGGFIGSPQRPLPTPAQGQGPRPQRLPGNARYLQQMGPAAPVEEQRRYPNLVLRNFQLTNAGADLIILGQPPLVRDYLIVRNSLQSAGNLYISFGLTANDSTASIVLVPGQWWEWDYTIPQDDVHIACDAATTLGVLNYHDAIA